MKITAIIPAAGTGARYSPIKNKLLEEINNIPVIIHTLRTIASVDEITEIIICASDNIIDEIKDLVKSYNILKVKNIILGGKTRQESVYFGLLQADKDPIKPDIILIHDGARPLISREIIINSINKTIEKGAAIVAVPAKDTIKIVDNKTSKIIETPPRENLWNVQTPQVFKFNEILNGHKKFADKEFTDDSAVMEAFGIDVYTVMGNYKNIKITTEEDLKIAKELL